MVDFFEVSEIKSHSSFINILFYRSITDAKTIADLEARIAKLDKTSKGVNVKGKITEGIIQWASEHNYTIDGSTVNVR